MLLLIEFYRHVSAGLWQQDGGCAGQHHVLPQRCHYPDIMCPAAPHAVDRVSAATMLHGLLAELHMHHAAHRYNGAPAEQAQDAQALFDLMVHTSL